MRRGDIVTVVAQGDYGKPRPAVIVQVDALSDAGLDSVIVCLMSSTIISAPLFRIHIEPLKSNGLEKASQIMVDKMVTVPSRKITQIIGSLSNEQLIQLNRTLAFVLGI
jgi:mRNA interferase MazF